MKVVLDTNIAVSAFLFGGLPQHVLHYQKRGQCQFLVSEILLEEFRRVLNYPRFEQRLARHQRTPDGILDEYKAITQLVDTSAVELPSAARDPDDNHVLACAVAGQAMLVVSGDSDLLVLDTYEGIHIITVADFVTLMDAADDSS